jgi:hypothetical protein
MRGHEGFQAAVCRRGDLGAEAKGRRTALAISVILSEAKDLIAISTGTLVESP